MFTHGQEHSAVKPWAQKGEMATGVCVCVWRGGGRARADQPQRGGITQHLRGKGHGVRRAAGAVSTVAAAAAPAAAAAASPSTTPAAAAAAALAD